MKPVVGRANGSFGVFTPPFGIGILPAMQTRGTHRIAALAMAVAVAVAVLGVAGCDSHSKPFVATDSPQTSAPVVSSSGSPSPSAAPGSPTSAPPAPIGPSAQASSLASLAAKYPKAATAVPAAVRVVRTFFDAINHETDTGDESPAMATFSSRCNLCASEVASLGALWQGGHTLRGGHLHLISIDAAYPSQVEVVTIEVTESQDAADQLDAAGKVFRSFPSTPPTKLVFNLELDKLPPVIWQLDRLSP